MNTQIAEIQRFQESEAASCLERNDLQERLRQTHERVHELEQSLASNAGNELLKQVPVSDIVPFSEIQDKLSVQRAPSPYYDPGDFAMLFMSDDLCPSSPFNVDHAKQPAKNPREDPENIQTERAPARATVSIPGSSPNVHQSPEQVKRKAVNFKPQSPGKMAARTSSARSTLTQVQQDIAERPTKMTKHVHKWTYSRVRSSGTDIQHEQPAGPSHMPTVERRTSPKGLVSASSGKKASRRTRTASRGRGKRQSRGKVNQGLSHVHRDLLLTIVNRRALQRAVQPRMIPPK